jgi:hypothetical protein
MLRNEEPCGMIEIVHNPRPHHHHHHHQQHHHICITFACSSAAAAALAALCSASPTLFASDSQDSFNATETLIVYKKGKGGSNKKNKP